MPGYTDRWPLVDIDRNGANAGRFDRPVNSATNVLTDWYQPC
jgi:hypothetical protein